MSDPQLEVGINLDFDENNEVAALNVQQGNPFPVIITVKNISKEPVEFDSINMEILFNSDDQFIEMDKTQSPRAGNLADKVSAASCAICGEVVKAGSHTNAPMPYGNGSELKLVKKDLNLVSAFKDTTGIAGMHAPAGEKFILAPGEVSVMAAGSAPTKDLVALNSGVSTLVPNGSVFNGTTEINFAAREGVVTAD